MPFPVKLTDVVEVLENAMDEITSYLDKRTGEIILINDEAMQAADNDELISEYPEWQRASILEAREIISSYEVFVSLPDKFDIHEYQIMADFCKDYENRGVGQRLAELIRGSGAFRRFRDAIYSMGIQDQWYAYKQAALEQMAIEWLEENEIPFTRDEVADASGATT